MSEKILLYIDSLRLLIVTVILIMGFAGYAQTTRPDLKEDWILPHESNANQTIDYQSLIQFCKKLAESSNFITLDTFGVSDGGNPLHYLTLSNKSYINHEEAKIDNKVIWWINNGIHPGEPEGIDATLAYFRDLLQDGKLEQVVEKLVIIIVPVYNVDGMLNRNNFSRVNQNGPLTYGFRANSSNLDLNRDFLKSKSKEAQAFNRLYNVWKPDVFLDNHTSNGADYQHTMTLLPTQADKLGGPRGELLRSSMLPYLYTAMEAAGDPMTPYVQSPEGDPKKGIMAFYDTPRYSSGYAALHGSLAMMTETHMLKPFIDRVKSVYRFTSVLMEYILLHDTAILESGSNQQAYYSQLREYPIQWKRNDIKADSIVFHGFELEMRYSAITGRELRNFNRDRPYTQKIPYYNYFEPKTTVAIPDYYIVPAQYSEVIKKLSWNGVKVYAIHKDTLLNISQYKLLPSERNPVLFEGQYYRRDLEIEVQALQAYVKKSDWLIPTRQDGIRYLLESLEPQGEDSFFRWNYFDPVLNRKEYFSDYVFEPLARELLIIDSQLALEFEEKIKQDVSFANDPYKRLEFIYLRSPYAEPQFHQYPILKVDASNLLQELCKTD